MLIEMGIRLIIKSNLFDQLLLANENRLEKIKKYSFQRC